jgi:sRNA-binding protein
MPKAERIDLMVKAGVLTKKQAEQAKKKLAEVQG